jgi:uncharacterized protein
MSGRSWPFFGLAYAVSWGWAIVLALQGQVVQRGEGWPTHYPSLVGPLVAAFVVTAWTAGRVGVGDLLARMARWRVALRWWLAGLSPAALLAAPDGGDFGRFSGTPAIGLVGVLLLIIVVNGLGEETGWRGYALLQLQRRFSALTASLILAPLWFLWHLPQFWVLDTYREFTSVQYVGVFLGLICGTVVLTRLYNGSGGSVLLVAIWHGLYNFVGATEAAGGLIAAVVTTLIMIQGVMLIVLDVRARRPGWPVHAGGMRQPFGIWVKNHVANPVMRPMLRSPGGRLVGKRLALIRYRGRRTGRVYELPVQYARVDDRVWILPGSPEYKAWWRNMRDRTQVDLLLAGHLLRGEAVAVEAKDHPDEVAVGLTAYLQAMPRAARALGLSMRGAHAEPQDADVRRISAGIVLVRVDLDERP